MKKELTKRASFGGVISEHSRIPDDAPNREALKWDRSHEKRELKAYLRGNPLFTHGREPAMPTGFRPVQFRVRELRKAIEPRS